MMAEDRKIPYEQVDIGIARHEMFVERLRNSSWLADGAAGPGKIHAGFYREEGKYSLSPAEAAIRLHLTDGQGNLPPGFEVKEDDESSQLVIGYSGPDDIRFAEFYEDLIRVGMELNEQNERERAATYSTRWEPPVEATNKVIRQIESGPVIDYLVHESGEPRAVAIAWLTEISASEFFDSGVSGEEGVKFLEIWHMHVEGRSAALHSALRDQFPDAEPVWINSNPAMEVLLGMSIGLEEAIQQRRQKLYGPKPLLNP
jgi:hypothetical protein